MNNKNLIFSLLILLFIGCKKDEVHALKKGNWNLEWTQDYDTITGQLDFKGSGRGYFYPSGTSNKYPFNYSIQGSNASFQFENPNISNTNHFFDIVIKQDTLQVWEENSQFYKSTFVIRK